MAACGELPVIPQVEREHVEMRRQIRARRLPVARRSEHPVQEDQRRLARATQITMEKKHCPEVASSG